MESIDGGIDNESAATNIIEAAVIHDGNNDDSTTADVANTTVDENEVISEELSSPESHQMSDAAVGEVETDAVANNSNNDEEAALTNDVDTAAATTNYEELEEKKNNETEAAATSNDVDLLGFTEGGTTDLVTDNQAEMSSFPESNIIAETVSNDFDLLGFGAEEKPQVEDLPISNDNSALDVHGNEEKSQEQDLTVGDISAVDENDNEVNGLGTEDVEQNNAIETSAVDEAPLEAEEAIDSNPISNLNDTVGDDLLNIAITNDGDDDDATTPDSETVDQTHADTVETTNSDVHIESGAVEDLLSLASNEPTATDVTLPESTDNEVDTEDSTQLNSEEVINNNVDSTEATDTQPNKNGASKPDSETVNRIHTETVEATNSDDPIESGAVEDVAPIEPSAAVVTLPEITDNAVDAEDSVQLNSEKVINNNGDASGATEEEDVNMNVGASVTTPDSETVDAARTETVETSSPDVPDESGAVEDLLSLAPSEPSAAVVTLSETITSQVVDTEDSTQMNSEEVININDDAPEATDTQPSDESLPPVLSSGGGIENVAMETEGSISDNIVTDAQDGDDAQIYVETKIDTVEDMSSPPTDEPSATIVALPESTSNDLNKESTQINVVSNNIELSPDATDIQTNEVGNTNIQEDTHQGEEGVDEVQTIEEQDGIHMAPEQIKEEANPISSVYAEPHTEEETEWLSMGLSLGDALRQIVALTDERDSALAICQEKDDVATQAESLLVEVQVRLEAEMNRRAESDSKARKLLETMKAYEERLESYEKMEDELEAAQANLVTTVSEKSKLELEIAKLREVRDESERKEAVLSNRLNEAKKKEANKSNTAGRLELDNEELRANLESTKAELESTSKAKAKLEGTMEKLKTKAVERVKQAETALKEERELNEERKKKMKVFVETKAEELREAKESAVDMQKELQETRSSLTASREREESIQKDLETARLKYREVQRDMERMKRNAEALHSMGNNLEQELEKSANETEEHKKKRISAKHELMTMMRTLEVEKGVSEKLRESMKFTFAPKAQSQQQLLSECLRDLEQELDRLSIKLGKSLPPQSQTDDSGPSKNEEGMERTESNGSGKKTRRGRASKADMDTERLISNLEQETQSVSKGIMALVSSIERMRILLDEGNAFNCMAFFSNQLGLAIGTGEARHQRLGDETPADDREETMSITSFNQR
mmetsp:Transcript_25401/g.50950  ORF Transcript_25401/g.50950 Transcript_25401/m.50950 type:complete len:1191 (-) Transcript_25401:47-3619(-)